MYDPGFPFLRPLLYGLGAAAFVAAAFATGLIFARPGSRELQVEERTAPVAQRQADDVLIVSAEPEAPDFPAFAPEGVIVVDALSADRTVAVAATNARPIAQRRVERTQRQARLSERQPTVVASHPRAPPAPAAEEPAPVATDEPRETAPSEPAREYAEAEEPAGEAYEDTSDNRSWYGSAEYRREVAERRRAEREARRRRNEGWW